MLDFLSPLCEPLGPNLCFLKTVSCELRVCSEDLILIQLPLRRPYLQIQAYSEVLGLDLQHMNLEWGTRFLLLTSRHHLLLSSPVVQWGSCQKEGRTLPSSRNYSRNYKECGTHHTVSDNRIQVLNTQKSVFIFIHLHAFPYLVGIDSKTSLRLSKHPITEPFVHIC